MGLVGLAIDNKPVAFEDVPIEVFPPELVNMLARNERDDAVHVTDLNACPYKVSKGKVLDFYWPVDVAYRVVRGTAWDRAIQLFPRDKGIYQRKFIRKLDGVDIVGTPDVMDPVLKTIEDVKAPARHYRGVPQSYEAQLNSYVWLSYPALDWEVESLWLNCVGSTGYVRMEVPMWSIRDTSLWLRQRLEQLMYLLAHKNTAKCPDLSCFYCHKDESIYV